MAAAYMHERVDKQQLPVCQFVYLRLRGRRTLRGIRYFLSDPQLIMRTSASSMQNGDKVQLITMVCTRSLTISEDTDLKSCL